MSRIKIKQINNTPASEGGLIVYDGNGNVWSNNDDGAILTSKGTTAQRPGSPVDGMIRFNTDLNCLECYANAVWTCVGVVDGGGFGQGGTIVFFHDAGTENVWLSVDEHHQRPSGPQSDGTSTPAIMPFGGNVYGLTFMNRNDSVETDLEFYINGTLTFTWSVLNKKWARKSNGLGALTFSAGDQISLFAKKVTGGKPDDTSVHMYYTFTSGTEAEDGGATL